MVGLLNHDKPMKTQWKMSKKAVRYTEEILFILFKSYY